MNGLEKIYLKKKIVALVFRKEININDVQFLTDPKNPFQIGFHNRKKGISLIPHIHKIEKPLIIKEIQEILYVQKGKIRVNLYTKKGEKISSIELKKEESILILDIGHGVDILSDAKIFQIKQGPYPGTEHAKIYFK